MKKTLALLVLLVISLTSATAKTKEKPDSDYQDGVLVSFRTVASGSNCSSSGTVKGSVDDNGKVSGDVDGEGSCSDRTVRLYTVKIGNTTYVLKPLPMAWNRPSVLASELPGARIKARTEKGKMYIKIGTRETPFAVQEAH